MNQNSKHSDWFASLLGYLLGPAFLIGFVLFLFTPTLVVPGMKQQVQAVIQAREAFLNRMKNVELVTMTLQPARLETGTSSVPDTSVKVCSGLAVDVTVRKLMEKHGLGYQASSVPDERNVPRPMDIFPSGESAKAWLLMPPLTNGKEFGFQITAKIWRVYDMDRYESRIFRFRARQVAKTDPPRFRLEYLEEIDLPRPYYGRP